MDSFPTLTISELHHSISEEQWQSSVAEVLPKITASLQQSIGYEAYNLSEEDFYDPTTMSVTLNQQLFDLRKFHQISIAQKQNNLRELEYQQSLNNVIYTFSFDWGYLWRNTQRELIIDEMVDITEQDLSNTEYRYEVGELTRVDVTKIESKHYGYLNKKSNAEKDRLISSEKMRNIYQLTIVDSIALPRIQSVNVDEELFGNENANVRMAQLKESIAEHKKNQEISDFIPTISGSVTAKRIWNSTNSTLPDAYNDFGGSVTLSWNLFNGTENFSSLSESNCNREISHLESEQVGREIRNGISMARQSMLASEEQITISEKRLEAALEVLEGTQSEYLSGTRSTTDLIISQEEYLNARLESVDVQMAYFLSQIVYFEKLGMLNPKFLQSILISDNE